MSKKTTVAEELCPICGNMIDVVARKGEIRKCPYCKHRYIVSDERRNRKYLEEYIKVKNTTEKDDE